MSWLVVFLLTFGGAILTGRLAMALPITDAPDGGRKQQITPVPQTGGLAIGVAVLAGLVLRLPDIGVSILSSSELTALGVLIIGAGLLGALDDAFILPALLKFAVLAGLALYGATMGVALALPVPAGFVLLGVALWLFVMPNAVNFMDGANGMIGASVAVILAGYFAVFHMLTLADGPDLVWYELTGACLITIAAVCGFLVWNFCGRLYAGDAGALALGALIAVLGLIAAEHYSIWLPATFVLPFLVDVFMTLLYRAYRRENLLTAHRHHAYQLFIQSGWTHGKTACTWAVLTAICVIFALLAVWGEEKMKTGGILPCIVFMILLVDGVGVWLIHRRIFIRRLANTTSI